MMMFGTPSNSVSIKLVPGNDMAEVTVKTVNNFNFNEALPYCNWTGIAGMSYPMHIAFQVPKEKASDVVPDLKKVNFDVGNTSVTVYNRIEIDIKDLTSNTPIIEKVTNELLMDSILDGDVKRFEADLKNLKYEDYAKAYKAKTGVDAFLPKNDDYPQVDSVIGGFYVALINGEEFKTKGEKEWWRLSAAYQQAEHQSYGFDWRLDIKVEPRY